MSEAPEGYYVVLRGSSLADAEKRFKEFSLAAEEASRLVAEHREDHYILRVMARATLERRKI